MSEQQPEQTGTPPGAGDPPEGTEPQQQTPPPPDAGEGNEPNKEAAKYRRRLRDAEAERDSATERLTNLQRQVVEQALEPHGVTPDAFWSSVEGDDPLKALVGEDGRVDLDAVASTCETARERFGIPAPRNTSGYSRLAGRQPVEQRKKAQFADVFGTPGGGTFTR